MIKGVDELCAEMRLKATTQFGDLDHRKIPVLNIPTGNLPPALD